MVINAKDFKITFFGAPKPGELSKTKKEVTKVPKWELDGIDVSKYMRHPSCPMCGLRDEGKEAGERPTEKHMLNCDKRITMPVPKILGQEITGDFLGQCLTRQLRYPIRLIRPVPPPGVIQDKSLIPEEYKAPSFAWRENGNWEMAKRANPDSEDGLACSYRWKITEGVPDLVWNGHKWISIFEWQRKPNQGK